MNKWKWDSRPGAAVASPIALVQSMIALSLSLR
jgi:hypothetical protein